MNRLREENDNIQHDDRRGEEEEIATSSNIPYRMAPGT